MLILRTILKSLIRSGTLIIIDADGRSHKFSGLEGPTVTVKFHNNMIPWRMVYSPSIAIGEGYMEGELTVENGTIYEFLSILAKNIETQGQHPVHSLIEKLSKSFKRIHQFNPLIFSRKNVAHHYDLSTKLYELFLDSDLQYSCGYFNSSEATLEMAQNDKKQHLAAKLMILDGHLVILVRIVSHLLLPGKRTIQELQIQIKSLYLLLVRAIIILLTGVMATLILGLQEI